MDFRRCLCTCSCFCLPAPTRRCITLAVPISCWDRRSISCKFYSVCCCAWSQRCLLSLSQASSISFRDESSCTLFYQNQNGSRVGQSGLTRDTYVHGNCVHAAAPTPPWTMSLVGCFRGLTSLNRASCNMCTCRLTVKKYHHLVNHSILAGDAEYCDCCRRM